MSELLALSGAAHWNQTEEDWRTMLALGRGWGIRQPDESRGDTLVASTLVLPYGDADAAGAAGAAGAADAAGAARAGFAWVSMVLVLPAFRGRGHARRLLRVALADLDRAGLLPVLDATPAGRPVYLKEGFVDGWTFQRWRRKAAPSSLSRGAGEGAGPALARPSEPRLLRDGDWPAVAALDLPAFGADRLPLLRTLAARLPGAAWIAQGGYLLGRDGRTAMQLGPLVAADEATAIVLLAKALAACADEAARRDLIVDLRDGCAGVASWLRGQGFAPERPFTRMIRGTRAAPPGEAGRIGQTAGEAGRIGRAAGKAGRSATPPGDAARVVLVAGPELG